jgi:hypothetical protein
MQEKDTAPFGDSFDKSFEKLSVAPQNEAVLLEEEIIKKFRELLRLVRKYAKLP